MSDETPPETTHEVRGAGHDEREHRPTMARWKMVAWFFLGCLGMTVVVAVVYSSIAGYITIHAIRDQQVTNISTNQNSQESLDLIKSCVTPDGECARRAAKNQAGFAGQLNQYFVLGLACQAKLTLDGLPPGITQDQLTRMITKCVVNQLDNAHKAIQDQR